MPFIGTQPEVGKYSVLDALTASATASYTLQLNSANFSPASANQLLVSLNGVIQKPGSSFTISGSTLTFSSALTSSDSIDFIISMGEPLLIGTPSDGTVSTSKIASNVAINTSGNITTTGAFTSKGIDDNADAVAITIDSSENVMIGRTSSSSATAGAQFSADGSNIVRDGQSALTVKRLSSNGDMITLAKDGDAIGSIGGLKTSGGGRPYLAASGSHSIYVDGGNANVNPGTATGSDNDNAIDLGGSYARWDDVFATNGTIQTSDQNEKQDIASLTTKELNVAKKLSTLFKTFRWKDKVEQKGDKARTHSGIVAQEVQSTFKSEGLDASKYGLFISDTWTNDDGKEQTRLGVRYPELFSFIFSSIEARLTALESK